MSNALQKSADEHMRTSMVASMDALPAYLSRIVAPPAM